jgi:hypothetical protein
MEFLNKLQKNIEDVSGTNTYNLSDILTDDFIRTNTTFRSYDDMIDKSGLVLNETTDEDICLNEELNDFIKANTKFEDFDDMISLAAQEHVAKRVMDL